MFLEIAFPQKASICPHELVDFVRNLTFIKSVAPFFSDQSQGFREAGILENVALGRCSPFSVECVRLEKSAWQSFIQPRTKRPVIGEQLRDWKTFFGIPNRRRKIIIEFQFAESFVQLRPSIHGSGYADRQHASRWNRFAMQFCQFGLHLVVTQTKW